MFVMVQTCVLFDLCKYDYVGQGFLLVPFIIINTIEELFFLSPL